MRLKELDRFIDALDYPITADEIVADHGDRILSLSEDDVRVGELFDRCGPQSFADAEEARLTLYSALPDGAIGRKGYSDRDPPQPGEVEPVSF